MSTLEEYVDKSEIPAFLGGDSKEPWTGGKGGDLPDKADKGGPPPTALHVKSKEVLELEATPGKLFIWEFRVLAHDVSFQAEVDGTAVEAPRKVTAEEGWVTFQHKAEESPLKITVTFDNSYSYFRAKDIEYRCFDEELPPLPKDSRVEEEAAPL